MSWVLVKTIVLCAVARYTEAWKVTDGGTGSKDGHNTIEDEDGQFDTTAVSGLCQGERLFFCVPRAIR